MWPSVSTLARRGVPAPGPSDQDAQRRSVQARMHRAALVLTALSLTAALAPAQAQRTRTESHRAVLVVDHLWRDGGAYIHDTCNLQVALQLRGSTAEMRVTGSMERDAAELSPAGPSNAHHGRAEADGTAIRNEVWLQDFGNERTTLTHAEPPPSRTRSRSQRR